MGRETSIPLSSPCTYGTSIFPSALLSLFHVREAVSMVFMQPSPIRFPAGRMPALPGKALCASASRRLCVRKFFPIIGKPPKNFSNHWKNRPRFSNHWKKVFQSLENPPSASEPADCARGKDAAGCRIPQGGGACFPPFGRPADRTAALRRAPSRSSCGTVTRRRGSTW